MPQAIQDGPHKGKLLSQLSDREAEQEYRRITAPRLPPSPAIPSGDAMKMTEPEYRKVLKGIGVPDSRNNPSPEEVRRGAGQRELDALHREFSHRRDLVKKRFGI